MTNAAVQGSSENPVGAMPIEASMSLPYVYVNSYLLVFVSMNNKAHV
jgi:hypothetical protein